MFGLQSYTLGGLANQHLELQSRANNFWLTLLHMKHWYIKKWLFCVTFLLAFGATVYLISFNNWHNYTVVYTNGHKLHYNSILIAWLCCVCWSVMLQYKTTRIINLTLLVCLNIVMYCNIVFVQKKNTLSIPLALYKTNPVHVL